MSPREALLVGAVLALLAFGLVCSTNGLTIAWSFGALLVTLVYPYAKRHVAMPQAVLGLAFGFGIPMAFAAVRGAIPGLAWLLMLGNLFWVLAYDTEYAMVDRDDDLRIGMRTSAITLGRWDVRAVMAFYVLPLVLWRPLFWWLGVVLAGLQVLWHARLIRDRSREGCFRAFRLNHWLGGTLFLGLLLRSWMV